MECINRKIDTCQPNPDKSYTQQYQKHEVSGCSYTIKSYDDEVLPPIMRNFTTTEDGGDIGGDHWRRTSRTFMIQ